MKKLTIISILITLSILTLTSAAMATVPYLLPVQGVLTDPSNDEPLEGPVSVTFSLYSAKTSDSSLWSESYTDDKKIELDKGFFTVYLGSINSLDINTLISDSELWLGVKVENDEEMPRIMLGAVPFALEAQVCQQVGSLTEEKINNNFMSSSSAAASVTSTQISNWNTAYGWGDHAGLYYTKTQSDGRYYTKIQSDGRYYTKSQSNSIYVNVSGDTMTGNLSLGSKQLTAGKVVATTSVSTKDYKFNPVKEYTYSIPSYEFQGANIIHHVGSAESYPKPKVDQSWFQAPLHLPNGADIKSFSCYVTDNTDSHHISFQLQRMTNSAELQIAKLETGDKFKNSAQQKLEVLVNKNNKINNASYTYYISGYTDAYYTSGSSPISFNKCMIIYQLSVISY
jgi:hypothetical protein